MTMKGKTLVKGHTLRWEGQAFYSDGKWCQGRSNIGHGFCSCGAMSESLDSNAARKRWHKQHKDEVRKRMEVQNDI